MQKLIVLAVKNTLIIYVKKKIMTNNEIKEKWICDECIANKLFLIK